ncbi:MAG: tRNA dihydrouridine synthase DusB [FCB group bacterium]|nr:tRNA dihydrouridine synthase DusB [FCB group bacterium]
MEHNQLHIGDVKIESPVFLAPMAGVTDYSFRILCKEQGAGVVYSEFVSAHGIIRENVKTLNMIRFGASERPIGIQIFGDNPEVMAAAAQYVVEKFDPDILDINYGCPVPKVTRKGAGSAALRNLDLMEEITAAVVTAIPGTPVTVKMRAGWDSKSIVIPEAGVRLEKTGVKAITLHPRTTKQTYRKQADWSLIKLLKESVSIPVIGNGDVIQPRDALRMFAETGCDAVMIGRAALGNPWFFRDVMALLKGQPLPPPPSLRGKISACQRQRHLELLIESHGEKTGINLMRKHFGWYLKGFPGAASIRKRLVTAVNLDAIKEELDSLKHGNVISVGA